MIIALDIVMIIHFSVNCSTIICSPTVIHAFKREASSETYGPRVYFPHYTFISKTQKHQKHLGVIYLLFTFHFVLQLSLLDLILASNHEGIDNPFIALGARVLWFV